MIPHSIRLRHPWDEIVEAGRLIFRRHFNRPTGLGDWERVSLEIDRAIVAGDVFVNGTPLGPLIPGELFTADITAHLKPTNELCVQVDPRSSPQSPSAATDDPLPPSNSIYIVEPNEPLGSPVGDVRLIIRTVHPSDRG